MKETKETISSVQKSCRLLKAFLDADKELGVTQLAEKLKMSKGGVFKLLAALESEGMVRQNPITKQYSLGHTILELAHKMKKDHNWINLVRPYLEQLGAYTKESVCLCIIDGHDAIYVDKIDSQYPIRFNVEIYRRFPLYATSAARSILAFAAPEVIDKVLNGEIRTYTPYSMKTKEEILQRLANIRARGYEYSSNLRNVGVTGIAAPIFDASGKVEASISIIGPTERVQEHKEDWIEKLLQTTKEISKAIGYRQQLYPPS